MTKDEWLNVADGMSLPVMLEKLAEDMRTRISTKEEFRNDTLKLTQELVQWLLVDVEDDLFTANADEDLDE
jgi:hypothetical protein